MTFVRNKNCYWFPISKEAANGDDIRSSVCPPCCQSAAISIAVTPLLSSSPLVCVDSGLIPSQTRVRTHYNPRTPLCHLENMSGAKILK